MQRDDFTTAAADLVATVNDLQRRVEDLEKAKPVAAVIPLRQFPDWYRRATDSPPKPAPPPVTENQLRRWKARERHFGVDWIVKDGRSLYVDAERFVAWLRRPDTKARVRP